MREIHHRKDYTRFSLDEQQTPDHPFPLFQDWLNTALDAESEVYKMVLSTSSPGGRPSSRIVLLRGYSEIGFIFYTSYESRKGLELSINPQACLLFDWEREERQVRIEGRVEKIGAEEAEKYFNSRPLESRISAIASQQSEPIDSRQSLEERAEEIRQSGNIQRPEHWGGYLLVPDYVEFWQGRPNRLHDRIAYCQMDNGWRKFRLQP